MYWKLLLSSNRSDKIDTEFFFIRIQPNECKVCWRGWSRNARRPSSTKLLLQNTVLNLIVTCTIQVSSRTITILISDFIPIFSLLVTKIFSVHIFGAQERIVAYKTHFTDLLVKHLGLLFCFSQSTHPHLWIAQQDLVGYYDQKVTRKSDKSHLILIVSNNDDGWYACSSSNVPVAERQRARGCAKRPPGGAMKKIYNMLLTVD